nr:GNAT family N-acetyltransferase [Azospirillum argentinense]
MTVRPAIEADCPTILRFVRELAEFENEPHAVKASEADFRRDGWGERPVFEALIAELDGKPVGFALCFRNYSTWKGGLVCSWRISTSPRKRGAMAWAASCWRRWRNWRTSGGCRRVDLNVLHWNPARDFYLRIGFKQMEEWLPYRLTGDAIAALAAQADEA